MPGLLNTLRFLNHFVIRVEKTEIVGMSFENPLKEKIQRSANIML